jgi:hypothetical protein
MTPKTPKKAKVKKRFVMGEGYPWYFERVKKYGIYDSLTLYSEGIRPCCLKPPHRKSLFTSDTGNWNKVRIICEVLK